MGNGFDIRAEASREVPVRWETVWRWLEALPGAFGVFPMLSEYRKISDSRYALSLGRIGLGSWKIAAECVVDVDLSDKPVYRFRPVAGEGNTEASIAMSLTANSAASTNVHVSCCVTPRVEIPRGAPLGLISRTTSATMKVALGRMLKGVERGAIELADREDGLDASLVHP